MNHHIIVKLNSFKYKMLIFPKLVTVAVCFMNYQISVLQAVTEHLFHLLLNEGLNNRYVRYLYNWVKIETARKQKIRVTSNLCCGDACLGNVEEKEDRKAENQWIARVITEDFIILNSWQHSTDCLWRWKKMPSMRHVPAMGNESDCVSLVSIGKMFALQDQLL